MCHNGEEQTDKLKNGFCRQKVQMLFLLQFHLLHSYYQSQVF